MPTKDREAIVVDIRKQFERVSLLFIPWECGKIEDGQPSDHVKGGRPALAHIPSRIFHFEIVQ